MESYILKALKSDNLGEQNSKQEFSYQHTLATPHKEQLNYIAILALGFSFLLSMFLIYTFHEQQNKQEKLILALLDKINNATNIDNVSSMATGDELASYESYISKANNNIGDTAAFEKEYLSSQEESIPTNFQSSPNFNQKQIENKQKEKQSESITTSIESNPLLFDKIKTLNINGHLFSSNPKDSFFMANNTLFSVGEYIDKENSVLLTKILERGIEVNYQNTVYFFDLQDYIRRT